MKRAIPYLLLPLLLFVSCKKEHSVTAQKYKVTYNLSGFTQQILGSTGSKTQVNSLKTNSTGLASSVDVLQYYLFDSSGDRINYIYQDSTYTNFGNITDNLPAGTYTVVFVGGKKGLNVIAGTLTYGNIVAYGPNSNYWEDTFFSKFTLTVSGGNVTQPVTMNRIVSELTIDIQDAIPANASTIVLSVDTDYEYYNLKTQLPSLAISPRTTTFTLPAAVLGTTNYKHSIIMLNTITPFNATITCYDAGNKPLGQVTVTNITLQANTQTILSGNLFGTNTGFNTSLNHAWDPNTINVPF